nr:uncharacterized protein LOC117685069 [Crassostrea gigas]
MEIRKALDLMHIYNVICLFKIAYLDAVRSKCGIYHGMDARVINIYKMDTAFLVLVLQLLYILNIPQGQCTGNGTCVCHCEDCDSRCSACLPGWSGSTTNYCQKSNTFFQLNATDNLLDGDLNTYTMSVNDSPFVRSQLNASTEIRRLDITLFQGRYIKGIFDIKVFQI